MEQHAWPDESPKFDYPSYSTFGVCPVSVYKFVLSIDGDSTWDSALKEYSAINDKHSKLV